MTEKKQSLKTLESLTDEELLEYEKRVKILIGELYYAEIRLRQDAINLHGEIRRRQVKKYLKNR